MEKGGHRLDRMRPIASAPLLVRSECQEKILDSETQESVRLCDSNPISSSSGIEAFLIEV